MLIDLQRLLQRALSSDAPLRVLRDGAEALPSEERALLSQIDPDGLVLTSLLVRKLRFENVCRGDEGMESWFEQEPDRFTELFRDYNRDVPCREVFPRQEAAAFRAYLKTKGIRVP